jgi:hypothetical protein
MADINKSWAFVLSNEDTTPPSGKVTDEPNGAIARLGINSHAWPEAVTDGFYAMALPDALIYAEDIFKYHFWAMIVGYSMVSQLIASKTADLAFNAGVEEAGLILQRAANIVWPAQPIAVDGICGAWTLARVNMICGDHEEALFGAMLEAGQTFYYQLRMRKPQEFSEALEAEWLRRLAIRPPV